MRRGRPLAPLALSAEERETIERWLRPPKTAQALALRSHIILASAQGTPNQVVAARLGVSRAMVGKWRSRFLAQRLDGLLDEPRPGAPRTVGDDDVERVIRQPPAAARFGGAIWDGKTLAAYVQRRFHLTLGVRQCQRLFRHWGFRLRKPRPVIAQADPERHGAARINSRRS